MSFFFCNGPMDLVGSVAKDGIATQSEKFLLLESNKNLLRYGLNPYKKGCLVLTDPA